MFLNKDVYDIFNTHKDILDEAGDPNMESGAGMGGDDMGMGEPPAEPAEGQTSDQADAQGGADGGDDMGGMPDDPGGTPGGDGMGGDPNAQGGDQSGMGGGDMNADNGMSADGTDPEDTLKKRRLFQDYKELFFIVEDLTTLSSSIPYESLSPDSKKIYNFIEKKMQENYDKLKIIMTEQYASLDYKNLMILFMYIKTSVKSYAELLKYFSASTKDIKKK